MDIIIGVGYMGKKNRFLWGPGNIVYYGLKIMEQKFFFEKIQISTFAPIKTGQKWPKMDIFQLY